MISLFCLGVLIFITSISLHSLNQNSMPFANNTDIPYEPDAPAQPIFFIVGALSLS